MHVEELLRELNPAAEPEYRSTGFWADCPDLDVRAMAELMRRNRVRLVTVTATPLTGDALRLIYHWDADGQLVNLATTVASGHIPTISDILPAADWVEREIRDYYGPEFDGRDSTPPLMLREGDPPGLFSRTSDQGHQADPAKTARTGTAPEEGGPR